MAKGTIYPNESKVIQDYRTGRKIRQITSHQSIHHHPFFMIPAYDADMERLIFVSHRTGKPQIFAEIRATGQLLQMTDREDLKEWSVHPAHKGDYIYFTAASGGWRIRTDTLEEEQLFAYPQGMSAKQGMVGGALGTTALSFDDRWWALHYRENGQDCLAVIDTVTKAAATILRRDSIAHLQFCPDDANLLFYAGPPHDRVWAINRDGSANRRIYQRNVAKKEWITHESWIPGTRELAFVDWPNGVRCVHADTGEERRVTSVNAWHAVCNRQGTKMVADTNFPDIGLQLFDPLDSAGEPQTLCHPEASSLGEHWDGPFPYDHGPVAVYAPQHTHPHPSFSPDGSLVVYTSDRSGFSQIYEVTI